MLVGESEFLAALSGIRTTEEWLEMHHRPHTPPDPDRPASEYPPGDVAWMTS